jgi:hypothetical protein
VKALGENTFEVQVSDSKTKVFNVRDLALYGGEEMPIYRSRQILIWIRSQQIQWFFP